MHKYTFYHFTLCKQSFLLQSEMSRYSAWKHVKVKILNHNRSTHCSICNKPAERQRDYKKWEAFGIDKAMEVHSHHDVWIDPEEELLCPTCQPIAVIEYNIQTPIIEASYEDTPRVTNNIMKLLTYKKFKYAIRRRDEQPPKQCKGECQRFPNLDDKQSSYFCNFDIKNVLYIGDFIISKFTLCHFRGEQLSLGNIVVYLE